MKDGNDLKTLREFVAVFGPYFAAGAEAQFILADMLLATNNEADGREAQTHLAQLRATAEDPSVRARATEALARLMIKNRIMEDAVGLYLQLGKEYPQRRRQRRQDRRRLPDQPAHRQAAPAVPGAEPLPAADADEGRAAQSNRPERHLRPVRGRAARATCSRCTAGSGSSSTRTTRATAPGPCAASTAATAGSG